MTVLHPGLAALRTSSLFFVATTLVSCTGASTDAGRRDDAGATPDAGERPASDDGGQADAGDAALSVVESTITASDGTSLFARWDLPPTTSPGPAMVLLHQYDLDHTAWAPYRQAFTDVGIALLSIDLRGHGASDAYTGSNYFGDPEGVPLDMRAAVAAAMTHPRVDPERVGVMGASVGANIAAVAVIDDVVKCAVTLSARLSRVEELAEANFPDDANCVYFAAATLDGSGVQAADAQTLFDLSTEPKAVHISDTNAHGAVLFEEDPAFFAAVVAFITENL